MIETSPTPMISDELLHALADQYQLLRIGHYGIAFDEYLADVRGAHERIADAEGFWPLLPAQKAVQERLDAEEEAAADDAERALERERPDVACRGGVLVEPLHHHAYDNRGPSANFTRRSRR